MAMEPGLLHDDRPPSPRARAPEAAAGAGLPPARNLAAIQGSPARSGQQKPVVVGEGGVVVVGNGMLHAARSLDDAHLHSRGDAARLDLAWSCFP